MFNRKHVDRYYKDVAIQCLQSANKIRGKRKQNYDSVIKTMFRIYVIASYGNKRFSTRIKGSSRMF